MIKKSIPLNEYLKQLKSWQRESIEQDELITDLQEALCEVIGWNATDYRDIECSDIPAGRAKQIFALYDRSLRDLEDMAS